MENMVAVVTLQNWQKMPKKMSKIVQKLPKLPKIVQNYPKLSKIIKIERLPQQLYFPHCGTGIYSVYLPIMTDEADIVLLM